MNLLRAQVLKNLSKLTRASCTRCIQTTARLTQDVKADDAIKFSTSNASKFKARDTFDNRRNAPAYEPHVISLSIMALLFYFCIWREENDVDEALGRGLFDHLPALEEQQLKVTLEYQKMHGQDTSAVRARLDAIHNRVGKVDQTTVTSAGGR